MIILYLLINLSLFSNKVEMLRMKNGITFETTDSVKRNGYNPITFFENIITPFIVMHEDKEKYFTKILETINLPLNYRTNYFDFNKKLVTKVKIDISLWKEKFPSDREGLKTFYSKLLNFVKGKAKEEINFHKFLFIHEMIIRYCPLEKSEALDAILYDYMEDDSIPFGYKDIILKNALTYEPLIIYKPILLKRIVYKYSKIGTFKEVFEERENFMNVLKIQDIYTINNKYEIRTFVKTLEDSLDSLVEHLAYKDILLALRKIIRIDLVYDAIKNNIKLNKLERFLEILLTGNVVKAIEFVNDLSINTFLRKALIINLIDIQENENNSFNIRDKIKKSLSKNAKLTKDASLTDFLFQFLPIGKFLLASKEVLNELNKKENFKLKLNESVDLAVKKYKELMKLDEVNKSNQIFRYIADYYLIKQAVEYSDVAKDKNFELFIFSTLSKSLENKRLYLKEIEELKEEIIEESYYSFLGIEMSLEIDNLIFSKILEHKSLSNFLNSYLILYNEIISHSTILSTSREFTFDLSLKRGVFEIISSNSVEKLENAKNIINKLLCDYPEKVSTIYLLLNRSIQVMLKNGDGNLTKYIKEIESIIEKYKK